MIEFYRLVFRSWVSLELVTNSNVIPGKLAAIPPEADQAQAEASATRNPGAPLGLPLSKGGDLVGVLNARE
jgi:hypothetical protein